MTRNLVVQFKRFRYQQAGLTSSEYAVILSLLIAVIWVALPPLANQVNSAFAGVQFGLDTQTQLVSAQPSTNAQTYTDVSHLMSPHNLAP